MSSGYRTVPPLPTLVCPPSISTRDLLERMNRSPYRFQVLTDTNGRLLGAVTDGDVRRALLAGNSLDTPVLSCINRNPVTGMLGQDAENAALAARLGFVPVVDHEGVLVHLLLRTEEPRLAQALIMAGGFGKRLGERTQSKPKPMLPVGDKPMIEHVLRRVEAANVERIWISVHYLGEQIVEYIQQRENICPIDFLWEDEPLGTAGVLSRLNQIDVPLLVINADVVTNTDLLALKSFHVRQGHDGTVAVARYEVDVPFGVIRHDDHGVFRCIEEKPKLNFFVAAGIYYLAPEIVALVPPGRRTDMPELLTMAHDIGLKVGIFPLHEYWLDVGRPHDLQTANRDHGGAAP